AKIGAINDGTPLQINNGINGKAQSNTSAIAGVWYWTNALNASNVSLLWTAIQANGLSTVMPGTIASPAFAWLASRPLDNSMNTSQGGTITSGNYCLAPQVCGTNQSAGCVATAIFTGSGSGQVYD